MVTITFKLYDVDAVRLEIDRPETLAKVISTSAAMADVDIGGFIAIRNGKVITSSEIIEQNDVIEVFPALSGG